MNTTAHATPPEVLRDRLVDQIKEAGHARLPQVEEALRTVPRHLFVPAFDIEEAYANKSLITERDTASGASLSCASTPTTVAMMLDQLDVQPGNRILEVGAGTGYNAALLAHLTGPGGQVVTIDVLPKATAEARKALDETRYGQQIEVLTHDGALGAPKHAPYSRLIFTVGAWDLPQTLFEQLAPDGRLVLPLRWRGQTRGMAFTYENGHLTADGNELCGFVPMVGQDGEKNGHIDNDGHVTLYWDADQPIAPADLQNALVQPSAPIWSGTTVGPNQPFDGVWMRLTATEPGTCRIAADQTAVDSGLCKPAIPVRSPAIVEGDSLAYFTLRRLGDENGQKRWELGATGHGPSGPALAERLCEQIRAWDQDRSALPTITIYPAATLDEELATGYVINKATSRLVITY